MSEATQTAATVETDVPARLDRLPWARWHWLVVLGLGAVWILDGLEVTIVGSVASRLTEKGAGLTLTSAQIGLAGTIYVIGACTGALFFGYLTDRLGRKRLFLVTLALYLCATVLTAFSFSLWWFLLFRFLTGAGIGGEYAAINSAIDELIPARVRGTIDLWINGSYWLGTAVGASLTLVLLNTSIFPANLGWRLAFALGAILGLGILFVRRHVPESPRWLFTHGHNDEAERLVASIEEDVEADTGEELDPVDETITVEQRESVGFLSMARSVFTMYPRRTVLGLSLFIGQAFIYNAVLFNFTDIMSKYYGVSSGAAPALIIPFAVGNLLGPLLLGRLFDTVGRRPMIAGCYLVSGVLFAVMAFLFAAGSLTTSTQVIALVVIFFFASAGASAAYLTVSEIFPMESRAMAIAFFYAVGTGLGGAIGPVLYGALIDPAHPGKLELGFLLAAVLMVMGGVVEAFLGISAEQRPLEEIAEPITAQDGAGEDGGEQEREQPEPLPRFGRAASWSPFSLSAEQFDDDPLRRREVAAIAAAALDADAPVPPGQLAVSVGARGWGPGRFRRALNTATATGVVRRTRRGMYEPAERASSASWSSPRS
jgi:MFS family permease